MQYQGFYFHGTVNSSFIMSSLARIKLQEFSAILFSPQNHMEFLGFGTAFIDMPVGSWQRSFDLTHYNYSAQNSGPEKKEENS